MLYSGDYYCDINPFGDDILHTEKPTGWPPAKTDMQAVLFKIILFTFYLYFLI